MVETIRGLVRPVVTFFFALVLAIVVCFMVFKFGDADTMKYVITAFVGISGVAIGAWFTDRAAKKSAANSTTSNSSTTTTPTP